MTETKVTKNTSGVPDQSFGKCRRLLKKSDFGNLREEKALFLKNGQLLAFYKNNLNFSGPTRIGISCSRKVGNSVVRNRIKRLIKEYYRRSDYRDLGIDILIVVRQKSKIINKKELGFKEKHLLISLDTIFKNAKKGH